VGAELAKIFGFVLATAAVLWGCTQLARRAGDRLHPEIPRKLVHVALGLATLSFPWLFDSTWPVVLLAVFCVALMAAVRTIPRLRSHLGKGLHGVKRSSWGEVYFAIAVALVFWLSGGDPVLFSLPVLVLTLADASGALAGMRYSSESSRYETLDGRKSVEGSVAFFVVCFLAVLVPLLLATEIDRAECLLIALAIAAVAMLIEAISVGGLDNLLLPLGTWALLVRLVDLELVPIVVRLGVVLGLLALVLMVRRGSSMDGGSLLGAVLLGYGGWVFGGWWCFVALLGLFASHLWAIRSMRQSAHSPIVPVHDLWPILSLAITVMVWLAIGQALSGWRLESTDHFGVLPAVLGITIHFALINSATVAVLVPSRSRAQRILLSSVKASLFSFVPAVFEFGSGAIGLALLSVVVCVIAIVIVGATLRTDQLPNTRQRWLLQALVATPLAMVGFLFVA